MNHERGDILGRGLRRPYRRSSRTAVIPRDWLYLWLADLDIPIRGAWIIIGSTAVRVDLFGNDPTAAIPRAANLP